MTTLTFGGKEVAVKEFHMNYKTAEVDPHLMHTMSREYTGVIAGHMDGMLLTWSGTERFLKQLFPPKVCWTFSNPEVLETMRPMPAGAVLTDHRNNRKFRIYRRDWKRNRLWMREIL